MAEFKILVTSQKGGVGKSTISANLAAYLCSHHRTALLDYDLHGSSSKWLNAAPNIGVGVQHKQSCTTPTSANNLRMKALLQMAARYKSKTDSAIGNFIRHC